MGTAAAQGLPLLKLDCPSGIPQGGVHAILDPNTFISGSNLTSVKHVSIFHNFSSVQDMTCNRAALDLKKADIECVGYYNRRETTKVQFKSEAGVIVAHWQTSEVYGNMTMRSECTLTEISDL